MTVELRPPVFDPSELARVPDEMLTKYDVPGPRYTSYPTAPVWTDDFSEPEYVEALARSAERGAPLSVYVHIPFCESLCVFCGCNVVITKRHERAQAYLERVEREIDRVAELAGAAGRETVQVAWGGGTPTYLSPDQIERLMGRILDRFPVSGDAELGIEIEPRVTTREHVGAIARAGFNRISMGIQDFDEEVQVEIHRVQSFEQTRDLIRWCREDGLESINVDLVYGLPLQTLERFEHTIDLVHRLDPDRISAFAYAHVPWLKPAQKKFKDESIPRGRDKFAIFTRLVERMCGAGYEFIGMDHFAKPGNELAVAQDSGELWRNFQGFTTKRGTDLVGLGVTSIGSFDDAFAQNLKDLGSYQAAIDDGRLAVHRGMVLSDDDRIRRAAIQQIMCNYRFSPAALAGEFGIDGAEYFRRELDAAAGLADDGLVALTGDGFELTSRGRVFVRNVCMPFDAHLPEPGRRMFSRTV